MKILHFGSVKKNWAAGLSFSIPNLIKAQNYNKKNHIAFLYNTKNGIKIDKSDLLQYDVVVLHSFFQLEYFKVLLKIPNSVKLIICPRGAFSKSNKYALKKHLYSIIYFSIIKLRRINYAIHFLTDNEKKRSRFKSNNDFVVGNAINIESYKPISAEMIKRKFERKSIVYIGRFDSYYIKGLDIMMNIIVDNIETIQKNNIKFDFYGPFANDKNRIIDIIEKHNLNNIEVHDEIYGDDKDKILKECTFHILNSRSEGFPMSVLESSSFYTPQLLSKGTNLQEVMISNNFGFPVNDLMFDKIINLEFEDYKTLAIEARSFAIEHSFEKIGAKSLEAYKY